MCEVCASMQKEASWQDVAAKGRAIYAAGGVQLVHYDSQEVECLVSSSVVAGEFPVDLGGPYTVILSKRSWENAHDVGGWVQGYLCSCYWGDFHSGDPSGPGRWAGRFCSHAMAALLFSNDNGLARGARGEFMNDRTGAAVAPGRFDVLNCREYSDVERQGGIGKMAIEAVGYCAKCGAYGKVDVADWMCSSCKDGETFDALVAATFGGDEDSRLWLEAHADPERLAAISEQMEVADCDGVRLATWGGHRAAFTDDWGKERTATRRFTSTEMRELDDEIEGRELHNASRLKANGGVL